MRSRYSLLMALLMLFVVACGGRSIQAPTAPASIVPAPSANGAPAILTSTATPNGSPTASTTILAAETQTPSASAAVASITPIAGQSVARTATPSARSASSVTLTQPPAATARVSSASTATKTARVTDLPGTAPQQSLGTTGDGLVLLNLRSGKNDGFTRLVFDLTKQDGSAAPLPRTRLWTQGGTVIIAFGGVRDDVYAQSLGSGEQPINLGAVQSVYRIPVRDDSSAAYAIAIQPGAKATLSSATLPTRVIVDIADK